MQTPAGGTHKIEKSPVLHLNEATTTKMYMERKRDKGGGRKPFLIKEQNRQREKEKKVCTKGKQPLASYRTG